MQKKYIKLTAVITGFIFMVVTAFVFRYCGEEVGGKVAQILVIIYIVLLVVMLVHRHFKVKHALRQADNADEYAKNSAIYHKDISPLKNNTPFDNVQIPFLQNILTPPPTTQATEEFTDNEILEEYKAERVGIPDTKDLPQMLLKRLIPKKVSQIVLYIFIAVCVVAFFVKVFEQTGFSHGIKIAAMMIRPLGFGLAVFAAVVLIGISVKRKTLNTNSVVYTKLVPSVLKKHFGNDVYYNHRAGLQWQLISRINCLGRNYTDIKGADHIAGRYKGIRFSAAQEKIIREYIDYDSDGDQVTREEVVFKGLMVCLDFKKKVRFPFGIRSNTRAEMINGRLRDKGTSAEHNIKTENDDFNTLFTICCNDEETAFYILTPDVMEKLSALYSEAYRFFVYTEDGKILFALNSGRDFLRLSAVNPSPQELAALQQRISTEIQQLTKLLDTVVKFI